MTKDNGVTEASNAAVPEAVYRFLNGPWENARLPTLVKEDPEGGDPHILAELKRVYNPDALYDLCNLANAAPVPPSETKTVDVEALKCEMAKEFYGHSDECWSLPVADHAVFDFMIKRGLLRTEPAPQPEAIPDKYDHADDALSLMEQPRSQALLWASKSGATSPEDAAAIKKSYDELRAASSPQPAGEMKGE